MSNVRLVAAGSIVLLFSFVPASAEGDLLTSHALERRAWWPYGEGPHYGALPEPERVHPRVIRLEVGDLDTRGQGLRVPAALRLLDEAAKMPGVPWLVQLAGPITESRKDALRERGVRLYTFYPSNTFVVRTDRPEALASMPGVLWAGPFHPAYRIEPLLGQAPTADPVQALNGTIYVRARAFEPGERGALIAALEAAGAHVDRETTFAPGGWDDAVYFRATPPRILEAARRNEVRWVEEVSNEGFVLNAESKVILQGGFLNRGTPFWTAGVDGSTQVVGDMDNGMDIDTTPLSDTATIPGTPGAGHRKVRAYTAYGGGDLLSCGNYTHGTNTSQCAMGNRGDHGQSGDLDGVAKKAKVVFQDMASDCAVQFCLGCEIGSLQVPATLIAAYDEVRSLGGHLTNGSFAICSGYGSHASDADQYTWTHKDFLPFFSAGNGGNGIVCPGTGKNVIAAGGFYQDPFFEFYGATGPSPDGRMGPTVMAPACDHPNGNPAPHNFDSSTSLQSADADQTGTPDAIVSQGACGTSFSSPYAMGAAALVRDYFEKGFQPSGEANAADAFAPSGALVKAVLLNSGEHMGCCGSFMESTSTFGQGMGRISLARTLRLAENLETPPNVRIIDRGAATGLATGGAWEEVVEITDPSVTLRATVNWTDRPGSALVNNLRLTVIGPGGGLARTYHGRNFSGQYTRSEAVGGTADDSVNPFEAVFISPAEMVTGTWTIRVEGTNVANGDPNFGNTQPFALVIAGGFATAAREVSPPGSSSPLVVSAVGGNDVTWTWENVGGTAVYDFYRGDLDPLGASGTYTHAKIDAAHCGAGTASTTVGDRNDGTNHYYLVGMRSSGSAGSLGTKSDGSERPAASPACP